MGKRKQAGGFLWAYECDHNIGKNLVAKYETKMSASQTKYPVSQYNLLTGGLISRYPSACHAQRATGVFQANIGKCCKGKYKSAGGFLWRYTTS